MSEVNHYPVPLKKHRFVSILKKSEFLSPDVKHLVFTVPQEFTYRSGAYININFINEGKPMGRAYSIASFGRESLIELCVKLVPQGVGSQFLFSLQEGDSVKIIGPLGDFFIPQTYLENTEDIFFICVGTGVAPFRAMIQDLLLTRKISNSVYLISGFRKESGILYQNEWEILLRDCNNFFWENTLSQPENPLYHGERGRIQILLEKIFKKYVSKNRIARFYICGLSLMIQDVKKMLISKGISIDSIHYESYN